MNPPTGTNAHNEPRSKPSLIRSIASLAELNGYEAEAKLRGISADEIVAIHEQRQKLNPKKRRAGR